MALENDYEIPLSYLRRPASGEESGDTSDSDFMDVRQMKPALPDTMPIRPSDKTGTLFVPVTNSRGNTADRRNTSPGNGMTRTTSDLKRSVSFASCATNAINGQQRSVFGNQPRLGQTPHTASQSNLYDPRPRGKTNPMAYVISVTNEQDTMRVPTFVTPNGRFNKHPVYCGARGVFECREGCQSCNLLCQNVNGKSKEIKKSRTFSDFDKNRVDVKLRNNTQRTQTLFTSPKGYDSGRSPMMREPLRTSSMNSREKLRIPPTNSRDHLRDSAVDLVSDEEDSEAYAAVSLAGTLSRNVPKMTSHRSGCGKRKLYVIIGVLAVFVILLVVAVVLVLVLK